jgi:hypothetical protein
MVTLISSNEERKGIRKSNILMRRIEFRGQILLERPLLCAIAAETSVTVIKYKTPNYTVDSHMLRAP